MTGTIRVKIIAALVAAKAEGLYRNDCWLDDLVTKIMGVVRAERKGAEELVTAMSLTLMNTAASLERAACTAMLRMAAEASMNRVSRDTYQRAALLIESRNEPIREDICYSFSDAPSTEVS